MLTTVGACEKRSKEVRKVFECLLIYLVPKDSFVSFTCPECPKLKDAKVSVSKGRLNVDMPDALIHLKTWEEALKKP